MRARGAHLSLPAGEVEGDGLKEGRDSPAEASEKSARRSGIYSLIASSLSYLQLPYPQLLFNCFSKVSGSITRAQRPFLSWTRCGFRVAHSWCAWLTRARLDLSVALPGACSAVCEIAPFIVYRLSCFAYRTCV